jgi:hypothetical protein
MSYHAGVGAGMSRFGLSPCEPHITCDGCGAVLYAERDGILCAWFRNRYMDGKPAPGWSRVRTETATGVTNDDRCQVCKTTKKGKR